MEIPPFYSPIGRRFFLLLLAVRDAAVNLTNTADDRGDRMLVWYSEFEMLVEAINRLADFEDELSDKHA